jgi:hypothetical protein
MKKYTEIKTLEELIEAIAQDKQVQRSQDSVKGPWVPSSLTMDGTVMSFLSGWGVFAYRIVEEVEPEIPQNDPVAEMCYKSNPHQRYWCKGPAYAPAYIIQRGSEGLLWSHYDSGRLYELRREVVLHKSFVGNVFYFVEVDEKGKAIHS